MYGIQKGAVLLESEDITENMNMRYLDSTTDSPIVWGVAMDIIPASDSEVVEVVEPNVVEI